MDCIFCKIVEGSIPSKKVYEDDLVIGILDINPNGDGHTLVIPKKHYTDYKELPDELILHINKVMKTLSDKLESKLHKNSVTFLVNYLDAQEVKHFHLHIVPGFRKPLELSVDEAYEKIMED
ncbi:MAG: HIT domain-containing protein [Bacilli bacterium]|nr:HIT domain-containing protein [Bacilli bacterium]